MTYDVLAICQDSRLRPLLSVRLVQAGMSLKNAEYKVGAMQRSLENSKVKGEEFFAIVPRGQYRHGETWKGTKETT